MTTAVEQKILEIELKELQKMQQMADYRAANLLEFFDAKPNPGPNPLQMELLDAWMDPSYKVFTYTGGNRIGKTTIGCIIAVSTVIGKFLWNNQRLPMTHSKPRKVRIVGQDWESHIKAVVLPELRKWWPDNRPVKTRKNNNGVDVLWIDEKTGGEIQIVSNNQDSDVHEGWQGDLIYYDEPPKRPIRVANARGLVDRQGREIFCMTLLKEAWVDREIIKATLNDGRPDQSVFNIQGDIYSNVGYGITQEGVEQFAKTLTEDEKEARLSGVPSYMSGLVYPTFQRKVHLKSRFAIPLNWIVDIGIDIHPREKQAILFCATNPRGERYIVNEIWDNGDGTWIGEQIIRCITQNAYRVGRIIIDPLSKSDGNNESTVFEKVQNVLFQYGYALETASKDKTSGIMEIKNHLVGPNKEPSLFVFDDLVRFLMEIEGYMWDKDTQKPMDKDDHMMENLYRLMLLNTQWTEVEDGEEDDYGRNDGRDPYTGY